MKMYFKRNSKKAGFKNFLTLVLIGVLIFQMAVPYGRITPYAAELGSSIAATTGSAISATDELDSSIGATTGSAIYVDGTSGVDTNTGTSKDAAFATIATAMTAIKDGDTLYIAPGTYNEPMNVYGKSDRSHVVL